MFEGIVWGEFYYFKEDLNELYNFWDSLDYVG